jgi:hypothetical protein
MMARVHNLAMIQYVHVATVQSLIKNKGGTAMPDILQAY